MLFPTFLAKGQPATYAGTKVFSYNDKAENNSRKTEDHDSLPIPRNGKIYVIAHRGAHTGIPENSLPAYRKAIDLGCDFVEIDTRMTKDGEIVSIHNSAIDEYVEGKTGKVKDFTLSELKQFSIGKKAGSGWENTGIPAVEEVLKLCRNRIGIYLDLKEPIISELLPVIHRYGMEKNIVWYIPASRMELIRQLMENCRSCMPMPDPGEEEKVLQVIGQVHPIVIATDMDHLSRNLVLVAHRAGAKVFVDEKNGNPEEWEKIISWGADGIQTDDPEALIRFLKSRYK
jgi:glycerophosphoryl diester phosphodiesterase